MMLPTLLVVPGIYLKSAIAHRTSTTLTPGFRLKVLDFCQNNGQFYGICLNSSPHSPFQRHFSFAVSCMIPSLARKTGEEWGRADTNCISSRQPHSRLERTAQKKPQWQHLRAQGHWGVCRAFKTYQRKFSPSVEAKGLWADVPQEWKWKVKESTQRRTVAWLTQPQQTLNILGCKIWGQNRNFINILLAFNNYIKILPAWCILLKPRE